MAKNNLRTARMKLARQRKGMTDAKDTMRFVVCRSCTAKNVVNSPHCYKCGAKIC